MCFSSKLLMLVAHGVIQNVITNQNLKINKSMELVEINKNEIRPPKPFHGIEIVNFAKTEINSSFRGLKRKYNENSEEEQTILKDLKGKKNVLNSS